MSTLNGASSTHQRRAGYQLLIMKLDVDYVDIKARQVVGMKPQPEFLPWFNLPWFKLKEPVRAGEVVLVAGDPDRIRTDDLWLDRPIC